MRSVVWHKSREEGWGETTSSVGTRLLIAITTFTRVKCGRALRLRLAPGPSAFSRGTSDLTGTLISIRLCDCMRDGGHAAPLPPRSPRS